MPYNKLTKDEQRIAISKELRMAVASDVQLMLVDLLIEARNQRDLAMDLLGRIDEQLDEKAPDPQWWRDYFVLTGDHMILTEEGWEPGELKAEYLKSYPEIPIEEIVLDEVNGTPVV